MCPKRKHIKGEQLEGQLLGELAAYENIGLFQRSVSQKSAYRYRGILLTYQKYLDGKTPSLELSRRFLANLRKNDYAPATIKLYRAALIGFHEWREEKLVFPIRVPRPDPEYVEPEVVNQMLELSRENPREHLMIRLMTDAGLRLDEVVNLKVRNVGSKALRIRGKGSKDRTVPLTDELKLALATFCDGKSPEDSVVGMGTKGIYGCIKRYAARAGKPELHPHSLRHSFGTRLMEASVSERIVQELMGHSRLETTQGYQAVIGKHLEDGIRKLQGGPTAGNAGEVGAVTTTKTTSIGLKLCPDWESTEDNLRGSRIGAAFSLPVEAASILIESLQVITSDIRLPFQLMLFTDEAVTDTSEWDARNILHNEEVTQQLYSYLPAGPLPYTNAAKTNSVCGAIVLGQRPIRLDLNYQRNAEELRKYHVAPVTFKITMRYRI
jgi:site-specific recombinase XerD